MEREESPPFTSQLSHFIYLSVGGYEMAKKEDVYTPKAEEEEVF